MDADGGGGVPLDEAAVRAAAGQLKAAGCEALVIHFLHSYLNPAHEKRALEIAAEVWPNHYITAGHQLLSEYREYERSEEHTSELQSLMRISYAVFCLKKKTT